MERIEGPKNLNHVVVCVLSGRDQSLLLLLELVCEDVCETDPRRRLRRELSHGAWGGLGRGAHTPRPPVGFKLCEHTGYLKMEYLEETAVVRPSSAITGLQMCH